MDDWRADWCTELEEFFFHFNAHICDGWKMPDKFPQVNVNGWLNNVLNMQSFSRVQGNRENAFIYWKCIKFSHFWNHFIINNRNFPTILPIFFLGFGLRYLVQLFSLFLPWNEIENIFMCFEGFVTTPALPTEPRLLNYSAWLFLVQS